MFWGLSSTFSEHYQPRALVLKLHEPPTPFYTWVSMHTHAAFSYQFSHVWTINVDALISNPYYVCTSNLQRNPKNQKKKNPQCHSQSLVCCFFNFFNFNLSFIIQFFKLFNILHAWKCLSVFSSFFCILPEITNQEQRSLRTKKSGVDMTVCPTPALPVYTLNVSRALLGSLNDKWLQQCSD